MPNSRDFDFYVILGFGSSLHRFASCIAVAIQIGVPCLLDDRLFPYDEGHLFKYYNNSKICPRAERRNKRTPFIARVPPKNVAKYTLLNIPPEIKSSLEFCHEDPAAWYRGVILKHMLFPSDFTRKTEERFLQMGSVSSN